MEAKRAAEAKAEEIMKREASEELTSWKSQRDVRMNSKKEVNRGEEQVFLEQQESDLLSGNTWDRVTKLVDLQADLAVSGKADTTRMRRLFIHLKNEPLESTRRAAIEA